MTDLVTYRPHRGILANSMREAVKLPATIAAIKEHEAEMIADCWIDEVRVIPYDMKPDTRIGWRQTWLVVGLRNGQQTGVIGMTDGPVTAIDGEWKSDGWHTRCGYKQKENDMNIDRTEEKNLDTVAGFVGELALDFKNASWPSNLASLAAKINSLQGAAIPSKSGDYDGVRLSDSRGDANVQAMTIREEFAARALSGLLACPSTVGWEMKKFARAAASHADELLKELGN